MSDQPADDRTETGPPSGGNASPAAHRLGERSEEALQAELADREAEVVTLRAQLRDLRHESAEALRAVDDNLRDQLRRSMEAAEGLERERLAATTTAQSLADRLADEADLRAELEQRLTRAQTQRTELAGRITALERQRDSVERAARIADEQHRARIRELDQLSSGLRATLPAVARDIAHAESSTAWRLGHGMSRMLNRVRRRPTRTEGALVSAMRRI